MLRHKARRIRRSAGDLLCLRSATGRRRRLGERAVGVRVQAYGREVPPTRVNTPSHPRQRLHGDDVISEFLTSRFLRRPMLPLQPDPVASRRC